MWNTIKGWFSIQEPPELKPIEHDPRISASARGYDWAWRKLRQQHMAWFPLCEHCEREGKVVQGEEVDHIIPFNGPHDPLRLTASNLQTLCRSCHRRKTLADQRPATSEPEGSFFSS